MQRNCYVTPAVSTVQLMLPSQEVCAAFGSALSAPARRKTLWARSYWLYILQMPSFNLRPCRLGEYSRSGGKAFALFVTRPYWVKVVFVENVKESLNTVGAVGRKLHQQSFRSSCHPAPGITAAILTEKLFELLFS